MTNEESILIHPYSYIGIPRLDIPQKFKRAVQEMKTQYSQEMIVSAIEEVLGITYAEMQSKYRFRQLVEARQMYCHYMKLYMRWTLNMIGQSIGGRDHTTVMHNINVFENLCFTDDIYKRKALKIKNIIEWKSQNIT